MRTCGLVGEIPSVWRLEILFMSNSVQEGLVHRHYYCVQAGFYDYMDPNSEEHQNDLASQKSHFLANRDPLG